MNHPFAEERIERAQDEIKTILPKRSYAKADNSEFENFRDRLLSSRITNGSARKTDVTVQPTRVEPADRVSVQVTSNEQRSEPLHGESAIEFTPPVLEHNYLSKKSQSE